MRAGIICILIIIIGLLTSAVGVISAGVSTEFIRSVIYFLVAGIGISITVIGIILLSILIRDNKIF